MRSASKHLKMRFFRCLAAMLTVALIVTMAPINTGYTYAVTGSSLTTESPEILVSGIEYAVLFASSDSVPLEIRVGGALRTILSIYNVPKEIRDEKIKKVLSMNYQKLGLDTLKKFRQFVDQTTEQALFDLLKRKHMTES